MPAAEVADRGQQEQTELQVKAQCYLCLHLPLGSSMSGDGMTDASAPMHNLITTSA